ncbi:ABC-type amino acid transport substrate-binding protein [Roseibium marinum]|uniref:ABC-type amino acid transport substrate-binding protein n=2 Tax=Roseibium marinum TaxID=281252 RepID=A0A2S3UMQ2_9HYPH|nr:ABC-type amino acid transport substrate-binding protein [Roseibium marinum]
MPAFAEPEITIVSPELGEGLQSNDNKGHYPELAHEVLDRTGKAYSYSVLPLKRVLSELTTGQADCVFGMDKRFLRKFGIDTQNLVESDPVLVSRQHIFTPPGAKLLTDLKSLRNKSVAILNGSNLEKTLKRQGVNFVLVNSQEAKLKMLQLHRVDAIMGWMPDMYLTADYFGIEKPDYDPQAVLTTTDVKLICRDDDTGRALVSATNEVIWRFRADSTFQRINEQWSGALF